MTVHTLAVSGTRNNCIKCDKLHCCISLSLMVSNCSKLILLLCLQIKTDFQLVVLIRYPSSIDFFMLHGCLFFVIQKVLLLQDLDWREKLALQHVKPLLTREASIYSILRNSYEFNFYPLLLFYFIFEVGLYCQYS